MNWLHAQMMLLDMASGAVGFAANWLLQSTLLIAAGLALGRFVRPHGSAVRSLVYRTTLIAVLVCPIATWSLSRAGVSGWSIKVPVAWTYEPMTDPAAMETSALGADSALTTVSRRDASTAPGRHEAFDADVPTVDSPATPVSLALPAPAPTDMMAREGSVATEPAESRRISVHRFGLAVLSATLLWMGVSAGLLVRLAFAWKELARLRRRAARADSSTIQSCRQLASRIGVSAPEVLRSPLLLSPCAAGLGRPAILLSDSEPSRSIRDVLIHELAHLHRRDCHWNLLHRLVTAVLCFQPLMWKLAHGLDESAEEVCDDYVVQFGGDRRSYARQLVDIAELSNPRVAAAGVGVVSMRSMLARRVSRIMDTSRSLSTRASARVSTIVLVGGLLGATLVGLVGIAPEASLADAESGAVAGRNDDEGADRDSQAAVAKDGVETGRTGSAVSAQDSARSDLHGDPLPPGAVARLGTGRLRQRQGALGVAFTPDGTAFASTGWGDSIRLWNRQTGKQIRRFTGTVRNGTFGVAFSPDGAKMASVGELGVVRLWDVETGAELFKTKKHKERVFGVAFAPDGATFATAGSGNSAGSDSSILLWDVATGTELHSFEITDQVHDHHAVAFSPDGKTLAAGSGKTIRLWNLETGAKPLVIENAHGREIVSIAFTPDGKALISSGYHVERIPPGRRRTEGQIRFWDPNTGKRLRELKSEDSPLGEFSLALSKNGTILASVHNDGIRIWDAESGKLVRTIAEYRNRGGARTHGLALSPDGAMLAVRANDHSVRLFDVATGKPSLVEPASHTNAVVSARYSPDGKTVATGSHDGTVRLWNPSTGKQVRLLRPGNAWARSVLFTPDGKTLIASGSVLDRRLSEYAGAVTVFDVETGETRREINLTDSVMAATLSADGKLLAVATGLGASFPESANKIPGFPIHIVEVATGATLAHLRGPVRQVMRMAFSPDGKRLVSVSENGTIRRWNVADGTQQETFTAPKSVRLKSSAFSSDARRLFTGSMVRSENGRIGGKMLKRELATGKQTLGIDFPDNWPRCLAISPNGRIVASYLRALFDSDRPFDDSIRLWEAATGRELMTFKTPDCRMRSLAFSPDGKNLVSGMDRGTALIWDVTAANEKLKR